MFSFLSALLLWMATATAAEPGKWQPTELPQLEELVEKRSHPGTKPSSRNGLAAPLTDAFHDDIPPNVLPRSTGGLKPSAVPRNHAHDLIVEIADHDEDPGETSWFPRSASRENDGQKSSASVTGIPEDEPLIFPRSASREKNEQGSSADIAGTPEDEPLTFPRSASREKNEQESSTDIAGTKKPPGLLPVVSDVPPLLPPDLGGEVSTVESDERVQRTMRHFVPLIDSEDGQPAPDTTAGRESTVQFGSQSRSTGSVGATFVPPPVPSATPSRSREASHAVISHEPETLLHAQPEMETGSNPWGYAAFLQEPVDVDAPLSACPHCLEDIYGDESGLWDAVPGGRFLPFGHFGLRAANRRVLGDLRGFVPLWQSWDDLLFLDIRGRVDDRDAGDFNIGLGYRTFITPEWIFGGYAYYDLARSSQSNTFHQATLGVDLLSIDWDLRINGHFPGSGGETANTATGLSNGTIITNMFQERAYAGFSTEIGRRLLRWGWNDVHEVRGFLGGYYFNHRADGFGSFGGPLVRLEYRMYDIPLLGEQSRLMFGVEASYDSMRNEQVAGLFQVRIPLDWRSGRDRRGRDRLDPLRRRMLDLPMRDID
jgi:hypothetical protein